MILVDGLRSRTLSLGAAAFTDAFFLSSTRAVNYLPAHPRKISLRPEGIAQILWTAHSNTVDHSDLVFEQLLLELAHDGISFVDREMILSRFSGTIQVAQEEFQLARIERWDLLAERYGPDSEASLQQVDPLMLPGLAHSMMKERLRRLEVRVETAEKRAEATEKLVKLSPSEQQIIARLRSKKERKKKRQKNKRSNSSKRKP